MKSVTNPDKYRLPLGTDELPVDLGPGWTGFQRHPAGPSGPPVTVTNR